MSDEDESDESIEPQKDQPFEIHMDRPPDTILKKKEVFVVNDRPVEVLYQEINNNFKREEKIKNHDLMIDNIYIEPKKDKASSKRKTEMPEKEEVKRSAPN